MWQPLLPVLAWSEACNDAWRAAAPAGEPSVMHQNIQALTYAVLPRAASGLPLGHCRPRAEQSAVSVMLLRGLQTVVSCRCARTATSWSSITQRISSPLIEQLVQCESAQLHERFHQNIAQKLDIADDLLVYNTPAAALYIVWLHSSRSTEKSTCGEMRLLCACRLCTSGNCY